MTRTTVTYLDAHDRTRRISFGEIEAEPDPAGGWYVDPHVVAFQRETPRGRVSTLIPLGRVLRIETTETIDAVRRRTRLDAAIAMEDRR